MVINDGRCGGIQWTLGCMRGGRGPCSCVAACHMRRTRDVDSCSCALQAWGTVSLPPTPARGGCLAQPGLPGRHAFSAFSKPHVCAPLSCVLPHCPPCVPLCPVSYSCVLLLFCRWGAVRWAGHQVGKPLKQGNGDGSRSWCHFVELAPFCCYRVRSPSCPTLRVPTCLWTNEPRPARQLLASADEAAAGILLLACARQTPGSGGCAASMPAHSFIMRLLGTKSATEGWLIGHRQDG